MNEIGILIILIPEARGSLEALGPDPQVKMARVCAISGAKTKPSADMESAAILKLDLHPKHSVSDRSLSFKNGTKLFCYHSPSRLR